MTIRQCLILFGAFFNNVIIWGLAWGAGIFQVEFLDEFGAPGSIGAVSFAPTLISAWTCLISPISSILTNRFGCKSITSFGAIIASCGFLLASFSNALWQLLISFTLIGMGTGLAYIPGSIVIVCENFDSKRPLALALASCGLGVGTFIMPPLIRFLITSYHWRGSCMILSGIVLNLCVTASLYTDTPKLPINKIINTKILLDPSFLCLILNSLFIMYGIISLYIHLPSYLESVGYSGEISAGFISSIGASILVGRIICGFIAHKINASLIYAITLASAGMIMIIIPYAIDFWILLIMCILYGFGICTLGPFLPLITTDLVGIHALSDAYAYLMVAEGVGSLMGPPIAGYLFDMTLDYGISMGSSGLCMVIASVIMIMPIFKIRSRKLENIGHIRSDTVKT